MPKVSTKKMIERVVEITAQLAEVKPLYKELDELTITLKDTKKDSFQTKDYSLVLVDNFAGKNTNYRVAAVKRFELKIEKRSK